MTVATATIEDSTTTTPRRVRYWEIDTLRGVAIVMMITSAILTIQSNAGLPSDLLFMRIGISISSVRQARHFQGK